VPRQRSRKKAMPSYGMAAPTSRLRLDSLVWCECAMIARLPAEIISHAVWLYHVFSLSLRDIELLLVERGVVVSMRPFVAGARNSARALLTACAAGGHDRETSGTSTRCCVHPYPGCAALSLARRGSGWRCARHPGSGTSRRQSGQAFLQTPAEGCNMCRG
jgi:hypothetical protein